MLTFKSIINSAFLLLIFGFSSHLHAQTLAEQLGYKKDDVLLIINNDDSGMSYASNQGTIQGMTDGLISSSTIMFNCPWVIDIVQYALNNKDKDFGVHLTLTSEWKRYKWATIASSDKVPSLLNQDGYLWASVEEVYKNAKPEEAYLEGKAQIERALQYGLDITHIDSHMGTFQLHPQFLEKYIALAKEFNLPLRMASQSTMEKFGYKDLRKQCRDMGLVFPDYFIYEELTDYKEDVEGFWVNIINNLKPGVTELFIHASSETDEIKQMTSSWVTRLAELNSFSKSDKVRNALAKKGVKLISYRPLLNLQRQKNK